MGRLACASSDTSDRGAVDVPLDAARDAGRVGRRFRVSRGINAVWDVRSSRILLRSPTAANSPSPAPDSRANP
jgi:hypothetical protein